MYNHCYLEIVTTKERSRDILWKILSKTISGLGVARNSDCYFYFDFEPDCSYNIRMFSHDVSELDKVFHFFKENRFLKKNFEVVKKFTFIPH